MKGWVYVISNKAIPDLVKIGYSTKDPELRAAELNNTGTPHPYAVDYELLIIEPYQVEQKTHRLLSEKHEAKEWFRCSPEEAILAIRKVAGNNVVLENFKRVDRAMVEELHLQELLKKAATDTTNSEALHQHDILRREAEVDKLRAEVLQLQERLKAAESGKFNHPTIPISPPKLCLCFSPLHRLEWDNNLQKYIIIYPEGVVELNQSSGEILKLCDGTNSLLEIIAELEIKFATTGLANDITKFIDVAIQNGWIYYH